MDKVRLIGTTGSVIVASGLQHLVLREHGLKDLEAALAERTGMVKPCGKENEEHTCVKPRRHDDSIADGRHLCRACLEEW